MSRRSRSRITFALGVVVLVFAAGVVGSVIGHGTRGSLFTVGSGIVYATPSEGTAYLGANQLLNRQPTGFAYSLPPGTRWIDANGAINEGGNRPPCVPYYHPVRVKKMEVVIYPIGGGYEGTVLWVQC